MRGDNNHDRYASGLPPGGWEPHGAINWKSTRITKDTGPVAEWKTAPVTRSAPMVRSFKWAHYWTPSQTSIRPGVRGGLLNSAGRVSCVRRKVEFRMPSLQGAWICGSKSNWIATEMIEIQWNAKILKCHVGSWRTDFEQKNQGAALIRCCTRGEHGSRNYRNNNKNVPGFFFFFHSPLLLGRTIETKGFHFNLIRIKFLNFIHLTPRHPPTRTGGFSPLEHFCSKFLPAQQTTFIGPFKAYRYTPQGYWGLHSNHFLWIIFSLRTKQ